LSCRQRGVICEILITISCVQCINVCFLRTSNVQYFITVRRSLTHVKCNGYWGDTAMRECGNQIPGVGPVTSMLMMVCWTTVRGCDITRTHTLDISSRNVDISQPFRACAVMKTDVSNKEDSLRTKHVRNMVCWITSKQSKPRKIFLTGH